MDIKVLKKSEVDLQQLADLTYTVRGRSGLLAKDVTEETILRNVCERITNHCYDWIFIAENHSKIVGWLAFYEMQEWMLKIAHIWNWHPVVFPNENEVAAELIQTAFLHLKERGLHKVTIDFPQVNKDTQSYFNKHLEWYSQTGITEVLEEKFYKKNITEENLEISIPDEYSLGYISETDLEVLFDCWVKTFSSSKDKFFLSLDAKGRRDFFFDRWSRDKPLIKEASLTLFHKDKLIGFIRMLPLHEPTDGCLSGIGILPEYRRKGLTRELLKAGMLRLKESNYRTISFFVSTTNSAAISFYKKLGLESQYKIASLSGEIT